MPVVNINNYERAHPPPHGLLDDIDPDLNMLNEIFPSLDQATQSKYFSLDSYNSTFASSSSLTFMHCNVGSYEANGETFLSLIAALNNQTELIIMTETWFSNVSKEFVNVDGYNLYHTVRQPLGRGEV
jgi:hypothetical protein